MLSLPLAAQEHGPPSACSSPGTSPTGPRPPPTQPPTDPPTAPALSVVTSFAPLQASVGQLAASPSLPHPPVSPSQIPLSPHASTQPQSLPGQEHTIGAVRASTSILAAGKGGLRGILKRRGGLEDVPATPSPHPGKRAWHWERKQGRGISRAGGKPGLLGLLARGCQGRPAVRE